MPADDPRRHQLEPGTAHVEVIEDGYCEDGACEWYVMNAHHHRTEVVVGIHCRTCPNAAFRRIPVEAIVRWTNDDPGEVLIP